MGRPSSSDPAFKVKESNMIIGIGVSNVLFGAEVVFLIWGSGEVLYLVGEDGYAGQWRKGMEVGEND